MKLGSICTCNSSTNEQILMEFDTGQLHKNVFISLKLITVCVADNSNTLHEGVHVFPYVMH
jgi:hypothetical protein